MATRAEVEMIMKLRDELTARLRAMGVPLEEIDKKAKKAQEGARGFEGALGNVGSAVTKAAALISGLATGAFAIFIKNAAAAASRAQEVQNLFDVSFGSMAADAEDWARRTQAAVGVNDTTLKQFSGTLFNMTTSMGLTRDGAFKLATGFTQLALDTSSFFNISFEEAFNKIRAGLSGESEPLKQLGVLVTENTIKQTDFAKAILATGRELTEAEKVQARSIVIMQGLGNAQGDLIRTQDSWANQTRIVGEAWTNLKERIGTLVTESPVLSGVLKLVTDLLNDMALSIENNQGAWEALVTEGLTKVIDAVAKIIDKLSEFGTFSKKFGEALLFTAGENGPFTQTAKDMIAFGESLETAGTRMRAFASDLRDVTGASKEPGLNRLETDFELLSGQVGIASEKLKTHGKTTEETSTVTKTYSDLNAALKDNISSATSALELSEKQLKNNKKAAEEAAKAYRELLSSANATFDGQRKFNDELKLHAQRWDEATDAIFAGTAATHEGRVAASAAAQGYEKATSAIKPLVLETRDWGDAMNSVNDFLSKTRGLMTLLGVESDSVFGKIVGWASKIFDAFNSITGIFSSIVGLFRGGAGGAAGGGIGSLLGGGGSGILGRLFGVGGGAAATAATAGGGTAAAGAAGAAGAGGGGLGGLGALLTNPLTALFAGGGLAAFFGIKALRKKATAETTAEFLGIDFGALTKDLQKNLQSLGKQIGDFSTALQLNLGQVFAEGGLGRNFDLFAEKAADTFSFLDRGQINAAQAQQVLNESVAQMLPIVGQLGADGVFQLERLFAAAERTGVSFNGASELAVAYVQRAQELGIAVNDVALRALGLEEALALLGPAGEGAGDSAESGLAAIAGAAEMAEKSVSGLAAAIARAREAGGGITGGKFSVPEIPGFQHGGFIPPTPGGRLIRVAEGGEGEFIVPESKAGISVSFGNIVISGASGDPKRMAKEFADEVATMVRRRTTILHSAILDVAQGKA